MRRPRIAAPLLALAILCAAAAPANAARLTPEAAAEQLGMRIVAGYGGRVVPAAWVPVEVTIDPPRALGGFLTVRTLAQGGPVASRQEVEIAPGSPKAYRFLVPFGTTAVEFAENDGEPVELRLRLNPDRDSYLVGFLGSVPADPPALQSDPTGLPGAWAPVDPAWLELSPDALALIGTLVAHRDALEALSPAAARHLANAIAGGATLVVVGGGGDVVGVPVPDLAAPERQTWTVRAADVEPSGGPDVVAVATPLGAGRVIATSVAPGDPGLGRSSALWSLLAQPRAAPLVGGSSYSVEQLGFSLGRLLTRGAAAGVPALPWLAWFIVAYVVMAGPLNALLLGRMRRRELAWATVPLITAVFTLSAFVSVSGARPKVGLAATATAWVDGTATEWAVVGVRAPQEGEHRVVMRGGGWALQPLGQSMRATTISLADNGAVAQFTLAPLQLGGVLGRRTADVAAPLQVTAEAQDRLLRVTVRNTSTSTVSAINVRAATTSRRIGDLAPGDVRTVDIPGPHLPVMPPWRELFEGLPSDPPGALEALLRAGPLDGSPGTIWAVGHVTAPVPPARVDGQAPESLGHVVAVGAAPTTATGALSGFAVRRELIAPLGGNRPGPLAAEGERDAILRLRLPPGPIAGPLQSGLERASVQGGPPPSVWVWDHRAHQWLRHAAAFTSDAEQDARLLSPLREMWVRLSGGGGVLEFSGRSVWTSGGAT